MRRLAALVACAAGLACARSNPPAEQGLGPNPPAVVRRLVTLAPSLTDLVVALGASERLVGVTRFDDAAEVASLPRVGGYSDPSAETILHLKPDVVLCQPAPGNRGAVELVAAAGIAVRVFPLESLADVTRAIEHIGTLLGRSEAARALLARIEAARTRAREAARRRGRRLRVAVLYDVEPLVAAGPGSFADELLTDAGADNVIARAAQPFPQVPLETLLARRPDVILLAPLAAHGGGLDTLPGPLRERARELTSQGILRPGPGVVAALEELTLVLDAVAGSAR